MNIYIDYKDAITLLRTSDIKEATESLIFLNKKSMMGFDVRIIEPHLITIDNQTAGTGVLLGNEKYEDNPIKITNQMWIIIINSKAYTIGFLGKTFDSQENIEIRENFIKSIKFLDVQTTANSNSRFGLL